MKSAKESERDPVRLEIYPSIYLAQVGSLLLPPTTCCCRWAHFRCMLGLLERNPLAISWPALAQGGASSRQLIAIEIEDDRGNLWR